MTTITPIFTCRSLRKASLVRPRVNLFIIRSFINIYIDITSIRSLYIKKLCQKFTLATTLTYRSSETQGREVVNALNSLCHWLILIIRRNFFPNNCGIDIANTRRAQDGVTKRAQELIISIFTRSKAYVHFLISFLVSKTNPQ